jgi:uncharacterized membrane protein SirB2
MYPLIKYIHVAAVSLSLTGFLLRGYWRWRAPERLRHPLARTLPHVNDTVLLASAITMLWLFRWSPLEHAWVLAKITALVVYILLGAAALRGPSPQVRTAALAAAVLVFLYIVSVALTKQVWPLA